MVGLWKHLRGGQVIQLLQLNHALEQLSELVFSFGFWGGQLSPHHGPFCFLYLLRLSESFLVLLVFVRHTYFPGLTTRTWSLI